MKCSAVVGELINILNHKCLIEPVKFKFEVTILPYQNFDIKKIFLCLL